MRIDKEDPEMISFLPDPTIRGVDEVMNEIFDAYGMERLGGASGRGWSSYATFQRCPYLYKVSYIDGERGIAAMALETGSAFHTFMALYYEWMVVDDWKLTPEVCREEMLARGYNPTACINAWRTFDAYVHHYENDYLLPISVEEWAQGEDGNTCRFDMIARVTQDQPGIPAGTYIVEHKCLHADEKLFDYATGMLLSVGEMAARGHAPLVLGYDEQTRRTVKTQATVPVPTSVRDVYEVVLESGRRLRTSENHPFLTARGWVPAGDLTHADYVALAPSTGGFDQVGEFTDAQVEFVGLMLGDGCMTNGKFTSTNPAITARFMHAATEIGAKPVACTRGDRAPYVQTSTAAYNPAQMLLDDLELSECLAATKFIPDRLFGCSDRQIDLLLSGLWNTDGCVDVFREDRLDGSPPQDKVRIAYVSRSKALCEGVQALLQRRGIPSSMTESSVEYEGERRDVWTTKVVSREGKRRFLRAVVDNRIPFVKYSVIGALQAIKAGDDEYIPSEYVKRYVPRALQPGTLRQQLKNRTVERETLMKHAVQHPSKELDDVINADLVWDRVSHVVISGRAMMYDITVPNVHNFVCNGIITHNTASRFTADLLEGWHNDGEVLGQIMIYKQANFAKKLDRNGKPYGKLQGTIVNIAGKQQLPKFHRTIVPAQAWHVKQHQEDLQMWHAMQQLYRATGVWPKARNNCVGRYGMCQLFTHCSTNQKDTPLVALKKAEKKADRASKTIAAGTAPITDAIDAIAEGTAPITAATEASLALASEGESSDTTNGVSVDANLDVNANEYADNVKVDAPITQDEQDNFVSEWTNTFCSVCNEPQFTSPGGITCDNGHGGAPPLDTPPPTSIDTSSTETIIET